MPIYIYRCPEGHVSEDFMPMSRHCPIIICQQCGMSACQVITAPLLVKVAQDVSYDSPIDGAPITSWAAREEDLKRSHCRPYDPEMKTDYTNRLKQEDAALDRSIEAHAEAVTEKMTTAQRGKLYSELTEQGTTAEIVRTSL